MRFLRLTVLLAGIAFAAQAALAQTAEPTLGADLYRQHCAACHGPTAEGDGPVAAVMQVNVPNLRTLQRRGAGVFPADAVTAYVDGREIKAAHGSRQMPIWGDVFQPDDLRRRGEDRARGRIAAIVGFIAELQYP
jgi:mono/diheme cytochrome c family protein